MIMLDKVKLQEQKSKLRRYRNAGLKVLRLHFAIAEDASGLSRDLGGEECLHCIVL